MKVDRNMLLAHVDQTKAIAKEFEDLSRQYLNLEAKAGELITVLGCRNWSDTKDSVEFADEFAAYSDLANFLKAH